MRRRRVGVGAERPEVPRGRELQLLFLGFLQPSEGVGRRTLIRCAGGEAELAQNYEVQERLGHGGFATVRRAFHRATGLPRALKTVLTGQHSGVDADTEWDRMMSEVEALMSLTHPNIVRLYEYYRGTD